MTSEIDIPIPDGEQILPHQVENVQFALDKKVCLIADPPGLGKSLSAIATVNCFSPARVLIVCPASLKINWQREWNRFTVHSNMSVGIADGKAYPETDVVIINYDLVAKYHERLTAKPWDFLVLDEAHYIRNPAAQRTRLIFGHKRKRKPIASIPYRRLIMLTGTPMTNRPVDLWNFCQVADPNGLGRDYFSFVKRYCAAWKGPWGLDVSGASNLEELGSKIKSWMIRHDKGILNLPPKMRTVLELPADGTGLTKLLKREADLYDALSAAGVDLSAPFEEQVERLQAEQKPDRVQMMTDLAATRQEVALNKLPLIRPIVQNLLDQDEKVIVFSYHKAVAAELMNMFGDAAVVVTGDVPMNKRQEAVDAFQADPAKRVFIGQIVAAGVGLTLTAARTVVFAEIDYSPANMEQAEDRAHRISQTLPVNVLYPVLQGSLDARIVSRLVAKQANIATVMGRATANGVHTEEA